MANGPYPASPAVQAAPAASRRPLGRKPVTNSQTYVSGMRGVVNTTDSSRPSTGPIQTCPWATARTTMRPSGEKESEQGGTYGSLPGRGVTGTSSWFRHPPGGRRGPGGEGRASAGRCREPAVGGHGQGLNSARHPVQVDFAAAGPEVQRIDSPLFGPDED